MTGMGHHWWDGGDEGTAGSPIADSTAYVLSFR
jgi:hypothetical protein